MRAEHTAAARRRPGTAMTPSPTPKPYVFGSFMRALKRTKWLARLNGAAAKEAIRAIHWRLAAIDEGAPQSMIAAGDQSYDEVRFGTLTGARARRRLEA